MRRDCTTAVTGSSPRVRGTHQWPFRCSLALRFIPAGAGNAPIRPSWQIQWTVHPRGCGERKTALTTSRRQNRFIPAGAGNANRVLAIFAACTVHPRGCGERLGTFSVNFHAIGSSPRVRGTLSPQALPMVPARFTPAGAGNAPSARLPPALAPVHPRGCGERLFDQIFEAVDGGSSPRVRGTRYYLLDRYSCQRFIPAGAGNARHGLNAHHANPVHPRGCGERLSPGRND